MVTTTLAQTDTAVTSQTTLKKSQDISVTTFVRTSLHENPQDPLATSSVSLFATSRYKLTDHLTFSLNAGLYQGINRERKTQMTNFRVTFSYGPLPLGSSIQVLPETTVVLPTNSMSRYEYSYLGALVLGCRISSNFSLFGKTMSLYYIPRLSRLLHRYTRAGNGSPNLQYKLGHTLALSVPLVERLSLNLNGGWTSAISYQDQIIEIFNLTQSLVYTWSKKIFIGLGHTNEASPFEHNGRDNNISFYDWRTSTVFSKISVNF